MRFKDFPNRKDRIIVLILWYIAFVTAVSFCLFLLAFQDAGTIITAVVSSVATIYLSYLIKQVSKGFFIKNMLNKKKYKMLYNETVKKFNGASNEFLKELKRRTYNQFMMTGDIYYHHTLQDGKWLLSDKDNMQGFIWLLEFLNESVVERTGFNNFINKAYNLTHNGELINMTLDNGFLSGELRYLLLKVYEVTEFNLQDNNILGLYSQMVYELKEKVNKEFTPLLYNFGDEIFNVLTELKPKIETNNDTQNNQIVLN